MTVKQQDSVVTGRQLQMWEEDKVSELSSLFAVQSEVGLLDSDYYELIIRVDWTEGTQTCAANFPQIT